MAQATFDNEFMRQIAAANIKPTHMGEYKKPVSFPFSPVRESTRKGTQLNSSEGLRIANEIDKTVAMLRAKQLNTSLIAPQTELKVGDALDMGNVNQYIQRIPKWAHPMAIMQGQSLPAEFETGAELEEFILENIFGDVPFAIGAAPNDSGIAIVRCAPRIESEEERFSYDGPDSQLQDMMEQQTEMLAEALTLEFLKVLFHVNNHVAKPFAMSTRPEVPEDIELLKKIMRLATQ